MREQTICQQRIISEEYWDFILGNKIPPNIQNIDEAQLCIQELPYHYQCMHVDSYTGGPLNLDSFYYNTIPKCYGLLDVQTLNEAGISQIQNYPTLQLKGNGILMGFIDTGIDYQNEVFRDIGGRTRILAIWDQTIQEGEPPQGYEYGTEYTDDMINAALNSDEPLQLVSSVDDNTHGTFVASVAAGGIQLTEGFIGAAPESSIAVVKLKGAKQYLRDFYQIKQEAPCYQENDIMLGIRYLKELANQKNMPLVLCLALGTNLGSHSGISPLPDILNQYADVPQMVIVTGVGNSANQRQHYVGKTSNVGNNMSSNVSNIGSNLGNVAGETVTSREEVEVKVGEDVAGFVLELWTEIPNLLNLSVISPSGEILPPSPLRKGNSGEYFFVFEGTRVTIDYRLLMERSNSELVFFQFVDPVPGIWKIVVEQIQFVDGIFHMWITDKDFLTGEVYFLESNPDTTICEPANAIYPITVSYYDGSKSSIAIQSGRGYTRTGSVKPDFAAPGVNVKGALPGNRFTNRTGSSIATAITAGAAALLLEWNVYYLGEKNISSIQVKNLLILGTTRDRGVAYPNTMWGYGKLDLFNTFENIRRL